MTPAPIPEKLRDLVDQAADESKSGPERLFAAAAARAELDIWLDQLASAAREEGHTWVDLGKVLGVSKQAAHKRFSGQEKKGDVYVVDWTDEGTGELIKTSDEDAEILNRVKENLKPYKKGEKLDNETRETLETIRKRAIKRG